MTETKKSSTWGFASFAAYAIFVVFVLALVLYASIQTVDMAEDHPYERGLAYQGRIDQLNRAAALDGDVVLLSHSNGQGLTIKLPGIRAGASVRGEVRLMRPSNERLDRRWPVQVDSSGAQEISTAGLASGLWRVQIDWSADTATYFYESKVILP